MRQATYVIVQQFNDSMQAPSRHCIRPERTWRTRQRRQNLAHAVFEKKKSIKTRKSKFTLCKVDGKP
jgi:hypothetical protein